MKERFSVGLDLGGTKLAGALVDSKGQILSFQKESILEMKSNARTGPKRIVAAMADMIAAFRRQSPTAFQKGNFIGVGLASAGPLNVESGTLINPANFPGWKTVPIRDLLVDELKRRRMAMPVFFQNDAIAAARAEGWVGGAKNLQTFAVVTIGTGIGSGVIFRGQPCQTNGMGSEFGHTIALNDHIKTATDLKKFTVEGLASGTGILRRAREEMGFRGENIEELVVELEAGASKYQKLFDEAADALAMLCYNLSIGFHCEKILFSGGLIKIQHLYFERLKTRYQMLIKTFNPHFCCPLTVAKAMNQAGVIGAANLPYVAEIAAAQNAALKKVKVVR